MLDQEGRVSLCLLLYPQCLLEHRRHPRKYLLNVNEGILFLEKSINIANLEKHDTKVVHGYLKDWISIWSCNDPQDAQRLI